MLYYYSPLSYFTTVYNSRVDVSGVCSQLRYIPQLPKFKGNKQQIKAATYPLLTVRCLVLTISLTQTLSEVAMDHTYIIDLIHRRSLTHTHAHSVTHTHIQGHLHTCTLTHVRTLACTMTLNVEEGHPRG